MRFRIGLYTLVGAALAIPICLLSCQQAGQAEEKTLDRRDLLVFAFEVAETLPLNPHHKDRARAQEKVINAALEADLPQLAANYVERIGNWRRGRACARLAAYHARRDEVDLAEQWLAKARKIARTNQEWRKGEILIAIGRAKGLLGRDEDVIETAEALKSPATTGTLSDVVVDVEDEASALASAKQLREQVREQVRMRNMDGVRNLLEAAGRLYDKCFDMPEVRDHLSETIRSQMVEGKLPIFIRIELLLGMADTAAEHGNQSLARDLVSQAQEIKDGSRWPLRFGIPMTARLARAFARAGQVEQADALFDASLEKFRTNLERIQSFDRGGILRTIAEALVASGRTRRAARVYHQAIEQGAVNVNLRPRAEDLSATAASMAVAGLVPDEALWARMQGIRAELEDR